MSAEFVFTKDNIDSCFAKLAKEFRKVNGKKIPAEIILIGGASVLINYGFRDLTYDIDAIIQASSSMKDAINKVGDEMNLPNGWLNSDFAGTSSYSNQLVLYSRYYKTFGNVLSVRTVSGEYLIAMKLMSGRLYKNDLSDVAGILLEQQKRGEAITLEMIQMAVQNLYGSWEVLPQNSKEIIHDLFDTQNLEHVFIEYRNNEKEAKDDLLEFEKDYPGVTNEHNVNEIIKSLKSRKKSIE